MENLKTFLLDKIEVLKENGNKFLNKEITMHNFKSMSGAFGIYAERGGESFMIRIKLPSGIFTTKSINFVNSIITKYDVHTLHLTTRESLQLHKLSLDTVIDIFKECVNNNLIGYGCGGNFPRNVTASNLSGMEQEAFDIIHYANCSTRYFMEHMAEYKLPRKIKVAFSNNDKDSTNATATDLGFIATIKDDKECFRVFVAGGLGRNPSVGLELPYTIDTTDIIFYIDALINLFREHGNYENRNKARIRYIMQEMGKEEFLNLYQSYIDKSHQNSSLVISKAKDITIPPSDTKTEETINVIAQKQEGRYTVIIKPACGNISSADFKSLTDFIEATNNEFIKLTVTMDESLYVSNLTAKQTEDVVSLSNPYNMQTDITHSVSCVGVPTCQIGLTESQHMLHSIIDHFTQNELNINVLPKIYISGCTNSCARHSIAMLGFCGKKKMIDGEIKDIFELQTGGHFDAFNTKLGKPRGDIQATNVPIFLEEIYHAIIKSGVDFDEFKETTPFNDILKKYTI